MRAPIRPRSTTGTLLRLSCCPVGLLALACPVHWLTLYHCMVGSALFGRLPTPHQKGDFKCEKTHDIDPDHFVCD